MNGFETELARVFQLARFCPCARFCLSARLCLYARGAPLVPVLPRRLSPHEVSVSCGVCALRGDLSLGPGDTVVCHSAGADHAVALFAGLDGTVERPRSDD